MNLGTEAKLLEDDAAGTGSNRTAAKASFNKFLLSGDLCNSHSETGNQSSKSLVRNPSDPSWNCQVLRWHSLVNPYQVPYQRYSSDRYMLTGRTLASKCSCGDEVAEEHSAL